MEVCMHTHVYVLGACLCVCVCMRVCRWLWAQVPVPGGEGGQPASFTRGWAPTELQPTGPWQADLCPWASPSQTLPRTQARFPTCCEQ